MGELPMPPGLYNMDCMAAMKQFPDGFFDLAVVDPPYGINVTGRHKASVLVGGGGRAFGGKSHGKPKRDGTIPTWASKFYHPFDDTAPPDEGDFRELSRVSKRRIIWGGNFFLDYLGAASCIIVWDKKRRGMDQADCEIAWTNLPGQNRIFDWKWNGMLQQDMKNKEERIHPTQKPVALYEWILQLYAKPGMKILDTHAGSASSLVACHRAGLDAWGYEIDETYYTRAKTRLESEQAQVNIMDLMREEQQNDQLEITV